MVREECQETWGESGRNAAKGAVAGAACLLLASAAGAHDGFSEIVEQVTPAVVHISVTVPATKGATNTFEFNVPPDSPYGDMFKEFMDQFMKRMPQPDQGPQQNEAPVLRSVGSGFIVADDGYIVTNNHVVAKATNVHVAMIDGREFEAEVIGTDEKTDIAVLKVESDEPLPFLEFGDSEAAKVGDMVMAIGSPHGLGFSASAGIISARNRIIGGDYDDFIQTDAAINVGNSGGPLFNTDGEVIGVNTLIISDRGSTVSRGIGFAMASVVVEDVVDQLRQYGTTRRGWLGLMLQPLDADNAEAMELESVAGALVADVLKGPAMEAGIRIGDLIVTFDGKEVEDVRSLIRMVGRAPVGKNVAVGIYRDGTPTTLYVTLGRREEAEAVLFPATAQIVEPRTSSHLGLEVGELTPEVRAERGIGESADGLVVLNLEEGSPAWEKGLRANDVIARLGGKELKSLKDFEAGVEDARDAGRKFVQLFVQSGDRSRFIALPVDE